MQRPTLCVARSLVHVYVPSFNPWRTFQPPAMAATTCLSQGFSDTQSNFTFYQSTIEGFMHIHVPENTEKRKDIPPPPKKKKENIHLFILQELVCKIFLFCSLQRRSISLCSLKLYCRYLYTRPCMINHIWGLKQLWLQVNGHAWFHLQRLRWPVRNGEGAKNSKWKYMSPAGFEPTPRQSTTGKLQRLRPLGHEGLMVISG